MTQITAFKLHPIHGLSSLTPEVVEQFVPGKQIGYGGTAVIYPLGNESDTGRVAVKAPRMEMGAALKTCAKNDAAYLWRMNHPNIVRMFARWKVNGYWHYAMERFETDSMHLMTSMELPMSLYIVRAVASALSYLHDRGILHYDMKSSNIFLSNEPDGRLPPRVAIGDFALARLANRRSRRDEPGAYIGTPGYCSSERVFGYAPVGPREDIYAMGCLLYEFLGGELNFDPDCDPNYNRELMQNFPVHDAGVRWLLSEMVDPNGSISNGAGLVQAIDCTFSGTVACFPDLGCFSPGNLLD